MAIFKCKMCGGNVEFEQGATVGVCDSCGTKQTLPRLDDDRRANLYDRANHFRRNNDFDKAAAIYEHILTEDTTDAEAYWSLVLCQYGIEYVEDPATRKRVPTVNRAQFTSIFDDDNYKSAIQYADGYQRELYEKEAKVINDIQKGILAISQQEKPFDVFICYKETDNNGRRTHDSVLANDLYHQLTQEGFKVFFSRITLEDKLGTAYEPYIFAALNSAKVMVVLGTRPEYFNAVWVKNEWSRFLALVKKSNGKKVLIPAYRDMDPYDLPEEFSHLQAQDMSKLGFMQDLIRGIKKLVKSDEPKATVKETVVIGGGNANVNALLKRAFIFLEDGDWQSADDYCEKILDIDPENALAYLGKLMAELKTRRYEELENFHVSFENRSNYQKAIRYGDGKLTAMLEGYLETVKKTEKYDRAYAAMQQSHSRNEYLAAADLFRSVSGYKDADHLVEVCTEQAEAYAKSILYANALANLRSGDLARVREAKAQFEALPGWKDSDNQATICTRTIALIKQKKKKAKRRKKILAIVIPVIVVACIIAVIVPTMSNTNQQYKEAIGKLKAASVGRIVKFGHYEQDNNISNGKEEIEWIVLAKNGDRVLILSVYALDCMPYNSLNSDVTWETCSLRKWLNGTFLNAAFNSGEKKLIQKFTITAEMNPSYSTSPGKNTTDKVFLLGIMQVNNFLKSDEARKCAPTDYAIAQGTWTSTSNKTCWWWLRSPGGDSNYAGIVRPDGSVYNWGEGVGSSDIAVRPAMWIDIGS